MPPAALIAGGALSLGSIGSSIIGADAAGRRANRAQRSAEAFFQRALQDLPREDIEALRKFANQPVERFTPTFVSPQQEQDLINALTEDASDFANQRIAQINESNARRGLFRSGIAAGQEREAATDLDKNLKRAISQTRLGFNQQRAQRQAQAFGLNQAANQQRAAQLQSVLGGQQAIFNSLLQPSLAALGGAGQASQAAAAANAGIGQSLGQAGQQALLFSLLSGGGGLGGSGGTFNPFTTTNPTSFATPNVNPLFGGGLGG